MRTLTESEDAAEDLDPSLGSTHLEPEAGEEQEPRRVGEEIAHFRVIAELGRGGMGVVYLADDLKLRRRVALKVLRAAVASNPDRRRRFLREARTASAVMHPNVAAVFEVGEAGTELYLAMEHVDGRTLADVIADRGAPLEIPEVLRIAIAVARGIGRAHEAGIIHRDIKPANVMVGADGLVKILDFGVARFAEVPDREALGATATASVVTVEGRILGTPGYMPPEQARGADVDVRTDMFAFGVMLYELVTGKRPFRGASAIEVLVAVERDTPAPPSTLRAGVPAALDRLVMRCLEKRPEDRFTSFREISAALEGLSLDPVAPPLAAPAPRRSRAWLAALGVVAVIVAGGVWIARSRRTPAAPDPSAIAIALASSAAAPASSAVALDPSAAAPASSAVASATASAAAASTVLARVCLEGDPGRTACTDRNVVTWCDTSGRSMGCCGLGLVPMGADGICACAPGGTSVREAIARGCPEAPKDRAEAYKRARDAAVSQAIDCFKPALSERRARGGLFAADYFLTPQGEVFGARVNRSTVPDEKAQTCALDVLRATRFPAPRGEDAGKRIGFGFEFAP